MVILDTNFFVAFFIENDAHHEKSREWYQKNSEKSLYIPSAVLEELVTVLCMKAGSDKALQLCKFIDAPDGPASVLRLDDAFIDETWALYESLSPHKLSYIDCLLIHYAKHFEAPVLTFDKELQKHLGDAALKC